MKAVLTVHADYRKAQIPADDIAYITVEDRKTKITRGSGAVLRTNQSLKDVFAQLPEDTFLNINRGIIVSKKFIESEKNGVITMMDGTQFRRRVRSDRMPKRPKPAPRQEKHVVCPAEVLGQWLDPMPMPMLVMELVYGAGGVDPVSQQGNGTAGERYHGRGAGSVGIEAEQCGEPQMDGNFCGCGHSWRFPSDRGCAGGLRQVYAAEMLPATAGLLRLCADGSYQGK